MDQNIEDSKDNTARDNYFENMLINSTYHNNTPFPNLPNQAKYHDDKNISSIY